MSNKLFEKYYTEIKAVVTHLVANYFITGMDTEDLEQELYLHFLKNIHTYNPEKNNNIKYWLRVIGKYQIVNLIRASKCKKRYTGEADKSLYSEVTDEFKLIDTIPAKTEAQAQEYLDVTDVIPAHIINLLSKYELEILDKYVNGGYNSKNKSSDNARERVMEKLRDACTRIGMESF